MRTIWKYPLDMRPATELEMPAEARVVAVGAQHETPVLWVEVETTQPFVVRWFQLIGTGRPVPPEALYLGSIWLFGGDLVYHVFEVEHVDRH